MTKLSDKALVLATKAHDGQFYGTGDPYVFHCAQVAKMAENMGYCDEVLAACYLHDIVEDTDVTINDLLLEFPKSVVDGVAAVTYTGPDYDKKMKLAMTDPIGHVVKFCDSSCNYANAAIHGPRPGNTYINVITRRAGYIATLLQDLPTPKAIDLYLSVSADKVHQHQ